MSALKAGMPRVFPDHRRTIARRLRAAYMDIQSVFPLENGVARRVAVLTALHWLACQDAVSEANALAAKRKKGTVSADLSRLRRRLAIATRQFTHGLEVLRASTGKDGRPLDLAAELARQRIES